MNLITSIRKGNGALFLVSQFDLLFLVDVKKLVIYTEPLWHLVKPQP